MALAAGLPLPSLAASQTSTSVAQSLNELGFRVFARLPKARNHFVSPYSLGRALAMAAAGSGGQTQSEFLKLLGYGSQQAFLKAYTGFDLSTGQVTLKEANSFWFDDTLKVRKSYSETLKKRFEAELYQTDFDGDPKGSADRVNQWASRATEGKIKKVLKPEPALRCVLSNAVYFKGDWDSQFSKEATKNQPFAAPTGALQVPTMNKFGSRFPYAKFPGLQLLQLPYQGRDVAMTILLPDTGASLDQLEQGLTHSKLKTWTKSMGRPEVNLALPKFKVEASYSMNKPLAQLGLKRAFSNGADFSGISAERLKIDRVDQKSYVEVDEEGTEAAAVTTISMTRATSVRRPPIVFKVDRPFLFTIEHLPSGIVLFLGRVSNPLG